MRLILPGNRVPPGSRCGAFTLPELIIVVLILAILAAIVVPQFTSASQQARNSALNMDLIQVRKQIMLYKQEHDDYPTVEDFTDQLTQPTDTAGNVVAKGTPGSHGPYLLNIPKNPLSDTSDVGTGDAGTSAWYYDPDTGDFLANDSAESRASY